MRLAPTHIIAALTLIAIPAFADDAPKPESPLVKLLKSGRVPAERQPSLVDQLGKRGTADDLAFLFEKAAQPAGLAAPARLKALDALAEAALTRKVVPSAGLDRLAGLLVPVTKGDPRLLVAAIRLAGLWKVEAVAPTVAKLAEDPSTPDDARLSAFNALVALDKKEPIEALADPKQPIATRLLAVAALARLGVDSATTQALSLLSDLKPGVSPTPLIAAFLDRQGGADKLAAAVASSKLSPDAAKLALRSVYELGRTDAALVAELTKAAGLSNEVKPPTPAEVDALIAEVQSRGNAARGEEIFRRADLNCTKCHALTGAGGGVGPELSAIGQTSPVDYLIYSILVPDQSIKEEFQTKVFLTADGRVLQGIVADKDEKRVILKEATGDLRTIPADEIEESKEGGSLMPKGLTNFMTRAEFVDLLRFLSELGKPGPYAIRSVPTIQRWRVLKSPASSLTSGVPTPETLQSEVLGSETSHWLPAYGKVNGEIPLSELTGPAGSPVLYLQGEIEVSAGGPITFRFANPDGVSAWIDDKALAMAPSVTETLDMGRHKLTVRVDTASRNAMPFKVEVARADGSSAEYRVVGGR